MSKQIRILSAMLFLVIATLACGLPISGAPTPAPDTVSTVVALTMQALTPQGSASTPEASTGVLPHDLYFLGKDDAGLAQVFRIERDAKTQHQVTFEPSDVGNYDVSLVDGSVVYVTNNQVLLVDANGSNRRLLVDGGAVDPNDPIQNSVSNPIFSPDAQTIAYGHKGLNLYTVSSGTSKLVLEKPVTDPITGAPRQGELYWPQKFSPDGSKILVTAAIPNSDGAVEMIYSPATNTTVRFNSADGVFFCCGEEQWTGDSQSLYAASPTVGMFGSGLWRIDAATGTITTLLPTDAGGGSFNLADEPYLAPDGQLYFFFGTATSPDGMVMRAPLQLVRSAPDGVTGRTVLIPRSFELLNEALWAPDASFFITVTAPSTDAYQGGQAELVYIDGRPGMTLAASARQLKWGP
jgi:hypothetical protein